MQVTMESGKSEEGEKGNAFRGDGEWLGWDGEREVRGWRGGGPGGNIENQSMKP